MTDSSKTRQMSKIDMVQQITVPITILCTCPAIYCVNQNTVSTIYFNIHLYNSRKPCQHAAVVSCFALRKPLLPYSRQADILFV